jgi:DNA-binding NtrC family response regulator
MTRKRHIVIVDDEANIGRSLRLILEGEGHRVSVFESASAFAANVNRAAADVYLLDVRLPDGNGIDLLRMLRQSDERAVAVMISGHGTIADAVEATKTGAFDFLEKPLGRDRVLLVVKNALEWSDLQRENQRYRELVGDAPRMIGSAPVFQAVIRQAGQVARSDVAVLLTGESGTGKELLAAYIHRESPFGGGPFVKVNCAAIPTELIESELFGHEKGAFTGAAALRRGKFELADGGTIFLDEVGDLHEASQAKLLRVLQDGELERLGDQKTRRVKVRLIAATNSDLQQLVHDNKFRSDLYYRLNAYQVRIPPLRERKEDVSVLATCFLERYSTLHGKKLRGFTDKAKRALLTYGWPGNIRELENMIERGVILAPSGTRIEVNHLFSSLSEEQPREFGLDARGGLEAGRWEAGKSLCEAVFNGVMTLDQLEAMLLETAIDKARGNLSSAARMLGLTRPQFAYRLKHLHSEPKS